MAPATFTAAPTVGGLVGLGILLLFGAAAAALCSFKSKKRARYEATTECGPLPTRSDLRILSVKQTDTSRQPDVSLNSTPTSSVRLEDTRQQRSTPPASKRPPLALPLAVVTSPSPPTTPAPPPLIHDQIVQAASHKGGHVSPALPAPRLPSPKLSPTTTRTFASPLSSSNPGPPIGPRPDIPAPGDSLRTTPQHSPKLANRHDNDDNASHRSNSPVWQHELAANPVLHEGGGAAKGVYPSLGQYQSATSLSPGSSPSISPTGSRRRTDTGDSSGRRTDTGEGRGKKKTKINLNKVVAAGPTSVVNHKEGGENFNPYANDFHASPYKNIHSYGKNLSVDQPSPAHSPAPSPPGSPRPARSRDVSPRRPARSRDVSPSVGRPMAVPPGTTDKITTPESMETSSAGDESESRGLTTQHRLALSKPVPVSVGGDREGHMLTTDGYMKPIDSNATDSAQLNTQSSGVANELEEVESPHLYMVPDDSPGKPALSPEYMMPDNESSAASQSPGHGYLAPGSMAAGSDSVFTEGNHSTPGYLPMSDVEASAGYTSRSYMPMDSGDGPSAIFSGAYLPMDQTGGSSAPLGRSTRTTAESVGSPDMCLTMAQIMGEQPIKGTNGEGTSPQGYMAMDALSRGDGGQDVTNNSSSPTKYINLNQLEDGSSDTSGSYLPMNQTDQPVAQSYLPMAAISTTVNDSSDELYVPLGNGQNEEAVAPPKKSRPGLGQGKPGGTLNLSRTVPAIQRSAAGGASASSAARRQETEAEEEVEYVGPNFALSSTINLPPLPASSRTAEEENIYSNRDSVREAEGNA